jgi:hypothetical protein
MAAYACPESFFWYSAPGDWFARLPLMLSRVSTEPLSAVEKRRMALKK